MEGLNTLEDYPLELREKEMLYQIMRGCRHFEAPKTLLWRGTIRGKANSANQPEGLQLL